MDCLLTTSSSKSNQGLGPHDNPHLYVHLKIGYSAIVLEIEFYICLLPWHYSLIFFPIFARVLFFPSSVSPSSQPWWLISPSWGVWCILRPIVPRAQSLQTCIHIYGLTWYLLFQKWLFSPHLILRRAHFLSSINRHILNPVVLIVSQYSTGHVCLQFFSPFPVDGHVRNSLSLPLQAWSPNTFVCMSL